MTVEQKAGMKYRKKECRRMNYNVDARGLTCPLPVVETKKVLQQAAAGDTATILVDNEIAVQNLSKFAGQRGYAVTAEKRSEKEFQVVITVSDDKKTKTETADVTCTKDGRSGGMVVVISGNCMGSGEEELGKALMKAFVFALTKQDVIPETVLLYNSGAYLSCEGSDSLEDLKFLEAEGCNIMTCGTCLNFYGLTEKLQVGTITNMYDIVETMERASKLIRP